MGQLAINISNISKSFTLHQQNNARFTVLKDFSLQVNRGECVVLNGVSGKGKSTILKAVYGNYLIDAGEIWFHFDNAKVEVNSNQNQSTLTLRKYHLAYVSQFLRAIPRVSALDIVAEPLIVQGESQIVANQKAQQLLALLNIPENLWNLSPSTFSGGEKQRINIAHGFIQPMPFLLLDEPTASLDEKNRKVVVNLIQQAKSRGSAIIGIFHDGDVRNEVADRIVEL